MMFVIFATLILILYPILGYKRPAIAVITSPIVCFLIVLASFSSQEYHYAIYGPVIFVATLSAILLARREPGTKEWPQAWAKWILISLAFLLLFAPVLVLFRPLGPIGLGFFVLFIGAVISYGLTSRHSIAAYVISTIGSSMRQNLPLPMALESAAAGRKDKRSQILRRIKNWLVQGYSLSESIKRGYPKCPGFAVATIAAAESVNQLPHAMKSIEADMAAKSDERKKLKPVHPLYPVVVITFVCFIVLAFMTFVIPKFSNVSAEMAEGARLPAATRFLMRIANFIAYGGGWVIGLVFALIILIIIPASIRIKFRPRRPDKPYLISRIGDFIKWHLPVLRWFEKNYSMVRIVEVLRLSLNAGCTINNAIANTLSLDVNNRFKKLLQKWLVKVEAGDNIAASARESGLASTLAWAFDEQINQGNTLAILDSLESFYRSNYSYRAHLVKVIMWPCIIILMGAMVGFVIYAMFSPSVAIINRMAELVYS